MGSRLIFKECIVNRLIVLLIGFMLVISGCGGADSRKEKYIQSGNEYYFQDICKKAKLDYKNALQIDPKTVDALIGLSRCMVEENEWRNAYQLLSSALETDPNSVDAKLDLSKMYLLSGDNEKSYQLIEDVLAIESNNATAIALRGFFHIKNSMLAAARTDADQAINLESDNLPAIALLSSLYVKDGQTIKATSYIEGILAKDNISKRKRRELQVSIIPLYSHLEDIDSVAKVYKQLITQYPDNNVYLYKLVSLYANNNRVEEAEKLLLSSMDAEDDEDSLAYIAFLDKYKSSDDATRELEKFSVDGSAKIRLALGRRYIDNNQIDKAKPLFQVLANDKSELESAGAKNELALLFLRENNAESSLKLVEEVLSEQPNNLRALVLRGTIALSRRDAPQAITDFRTILRDQPNNTYAIRQLTSAYIVNDQVELARELVQKAVEIDSNDKQLGLLYARLQGKDNEFESAIETVNDLLKTNENDLETIKTLFDLQIANKDYIGAKETAESMKSSLSDNPLGYYLSGVLLQNENNPLAAEKEYLAALDKQARANEPLSGLVRLYLSQNQQSKAIAMLRNIIKNDPEYLVPYNLLGEVGLSMKDYKLASDSFESAIKVNTNWWLPYRGLSLVHSAQGNIDKSINVLKRGFDKGVGVERLGLALALAQYQQGRRVDAINTYEKIIKEVPTSMLSKNNLAMILVDDQANDREIDKALVYVSDLENINEAASLDTVGWVYYKAGKIANAIEVLEKAVGLAPKAAELHYHLGMAYSEQDGGVEKAKQHLKAAIESDQSYVGKNIAEQKLKQL